MGRMRKKNRLTITSKLIFYALIFTALLLIFLFSIFGCISANVSTGASTEAEVKAKSSLQNIQSNAQTDRVALEVAPTTITMPDKTVITIGGANAETGSTSNQQSDTEILNQIKAKAEANAEATAKSSVNLTYLLIAGFLILGGISIFKIWLYKK